MTWLELAQLVRETVAPFAYGPVEGAGGILVVENPDCEGGGYDVYSTPTFRDAVEACTKIMQARATVNDTRPEYLSYEASAFPVARDHTWPKN